MFPLRRRYQSPHAFVARWNYPLGQNISWGVRGLEKGLVKEQLFSEYVLHQAARQPDLYSGNIMQ
jgi:hypothetical protein